ncbi:MULTISPECIES: hypothetical protein [unclassified Streptomyces]|uniref:hypothetical protein n=1 Tax=unclassified Streptomyces TaxID=2593676 RepID=UPI002E29793D|nr:MULTISPECIES: hypothetical protein [unclassified Streptomyces]WUB88408.1 hypothetical protein OG812_18215 [Streptomyces sp. NBC_00566]
MSAMSIALLLTTAATGAVGVAVLCTVLRLRRQIAELHTQLAANQAAEIRALLPAARTTADAEEIREAVAAALAEERERELAEARAFWAAQEVRDLSDAPPPLYGLDADTFLPRPSDFAGLEPVSEPAVEPDEFSGDSPELAAARRRHPSHPDFVPVQSPVGDEEDRAVTILERLSVEGTALADVRPGPLGTLDVYVFADGTTLCMTPGHRETAERLATALREGKAPCLLGGSGISGAFTLTFACGEETVYVLADRVIASL